jgi:hypothetical protein
MMKTLTNYTKEMKKLILFIGLMVASNISFSQTTTAGSDNKPFSGKPIIVKNDRTTLRHAQPSGDKEFNTHVKKHIRENWKDEKHDKKRRERHEHRDRVPHR